MRGKPGQRDQRTPGVVFQPSVYQGFQRGVNQMVNAVRPTLGPLPRLVAIAQAAAGQPPELLDDGGAISRRIVQLAHRDEDVGAMFIRHVLWHLHQEAGDGTATAAVLFQSVFDQGVRYIVSGGDPMLLRRHLESGRQLIVDQLSRMTTHLEGKTHLSRVAETICHDPEMATMLGEIIDIVGEHGQLDIRSGRRREIEREYVEGMYWDGGVLSREMIIDHTRLRTDIEDAAILISDLEIEEPGQLVPLLDAVFGADVPGLLVIASKFSESALAFLLASRKADRWPIVAVETPGTGDYGKATAIADLAILVGGRPLMRAAGDTLDGVSFTNLGRARRAWADRSHFGIVGGKGDPRALRVHIASLRTSFSRATDPDQRRRLQQRIGKLMGGSAILQVGGITEREITSRKEMAEGTAEALRGAVRDGVVPGAGMSLLACRPALQQRLDQSTDPDERAAGRILLRALEEPARAIISNAGYDASEVLVEIKSAPPGHGFDARCGQVVNLADAGILDPAAVSKAVVVHAIVSAAQALTVEVLVHRKDPPLAAADL